MAKSKRFVRLEHSEDIDRISSLPNPLLSRILSLLPTKNAVATSLLSTRWRFVWTSITNLDFNGNRTSNIYYPSMSLYMVREKFTHFVNRVLLLLSPPCIQNFRLKCYYEFCDTSYLNSWICAAIGRTVHELELHLQLEDQPMELPFNHFFCKTLAVLKLSGDIHFNIAASASICFPNLSTFHLSQITFTIASTCSVSFPNLKDLLLDSVIYVNEESVHNLFASCPVLHNLVIYRSDRDNVLCLTIFIPSLRSLKCFGLFKRHPEGHGYKLQIDTPALKYLYLEDYFMCEYFTADNLSSLLEARVNSDFDESLTIDANSYNISIFKFIGGLFNVKILSISGGILKAISSISVNIGPVFRNLMQLELGKDSCRDWSAVIKNWLESSDNLEHLVMMGSSCRGSHESWWTEPVLVPMCLQRGVTTISFTTMIGECSDELELVRYFLKNGKVLQLLTVDSLGGSDAEKIKMMQKISMMPRGSQACQVEFK